METSMTDDDKQMEWLAALLPQDITNTIKRQQRYIDREDLRGSGLVGKPHITVIQANKHVKQPKLSADTFNAIRKEVSNVDDVSVGEPLKLSTGEGESAIALSVKSDKLKQINADIQNTHNIINKHKEYIPHITVATVSDDSADEYIDHLKNAMLVNADMKILSTILKTANADKLMSKHAHIIDNLRTDYIDKGALEVMERNDITYSQYLDNGMDKEAFIFTGTAAAIGTLVGLGFTLWSAYDLGKGLYHTGKDVYHGRYKEAIKRLPGVAMNAAFTALPGTGVLKGAGKVAKGGFAVLKGEHALAGAVKAGNKLSKLKAGKSLMLDPMTWGKAGRVRGVSKYTAELARHEAEAAKIGKSLAKKLGHKGDIFKMVEQPRSMTQLFKGDKGNMKKGYAMFNNKYGKFLHNYGSTAETVGGALAIAPLAATMGGSLTGSKALSDFGSRADDFLFYEGEEGEGALGGTVHHAMPNPTRAYNKYNRYN